MRVPIQSERDAFRSVVGFATLTGVCLPLGYLVGPLPAIILASVVLAATLGFTLARTPQGSSLQEAEAAGRHDGDVRRVLLVANEAPTRQQLRHALFQATQSRPTLEVHTPVLQS